jgi:uncharacterized protein YbjT (DUF2867 family)
MKIVVIDGAGLVGSRLVARLRMDGRESLVLSPGSRLDQALAGAQVVVDVSSAPAEDLLAAEASAGVGHHVALSCIGADLFGASGWFHAKLAQEQAVKAGPVPYTILRAAPLFELVDRMVASSANGRGIRLPLAVVQPVAADDVAGSLADVAVGSPLNDTVELAGPEAFRLDELARRFLQARGDRRPVTTDARACRFGDELDRHALTPGDDARIASTRFDDWLDQS